MRTVQLNQNEATLLEKLLNTYITKQETTISEKEETTEETGRNATISIKISEARELLAKIQN